MVMPKDNDRTVTFDLGEMKSAVRRISLMADERARSIRMMVREGEVELTAQSSEEGEGSEAVPAEYKGEEMLLGFNWQYLQEFLNNVGAIETSGEQSAVSSQQSDGGDAASDEASTGSAAARAKDTPGATRIKFEFKDANAATQMSIAGDTSYDYKYIVMPLRI
jgi:DNA polymerase III sliding clamp (beta) subunit (PCNA family)